MVWLGLHEYSAPTIYYASTRDGQGRYPGVAPHDTGWLTLRYRQLYNQVLKPAGRAIPLVMTELGVDGLVTNRPARKTLRAGSTSRSTGPSTASVPGARVHTWSSLSGMIRQCNRILT